MRNSFNCSNTKQANTIIEHIYDKYNFSQNEETNKHIHRNNVPIKNNLDQE